MKFGRQEKRKLVEILGDRSEDFVNRYGTHKERWVQYLQMNGILAQPCSLRPRKGLVMFKASFLEDSELWFSIPEGLATKILVLGFAPPRNKRKEKKVEYRVERNGRKIAVAPTAESAGSRMFKFLTKARANHEFTIVDPEGKIFVKICKRKDIRVPTRS